MSDEEDRVFINGLAAQQLAIRQEKAQLRLQMRVFPQNEAAVIRGKLIALDEKELRIKKLLDIAKQDGLSPEHIGNEQSDLAQRIFGRKDVRQSRVPEENNQSDLAKRIFGNKV